MAQHQHSRPDPLVGDADDAASTAMISCLICAQRVVTDAMERHMERRHLNYQRHACQDCEFCAFDWRAMGMHAEEMGHRALLNSNRNDYTERLVKRLRKDCMKAARGEALSQSSISSTSASSSAAASLPNANSVGDGQADLATEAMKMEPRSRGSTPEPVRESAAAVVDGKAASKGKKDGGQAGGGKVAKKKKKKKAAEKGSLTCLFAGCGSKVLVNGPELRMKRRHIESDHLGIVMQCPVGECTSTQSNLNALSSHIGVIHKGVENLIDEQRVAYRELRQQVNSAVNNLLPQCFPDAAAEDGVAAPPTRRRRRCRG